jgi:hypothetical protein
MYQKKDGSNPSKGLRVAPFRSAAVCGEPVELHVAALQKGEHLNLEAVIISTSLCAFAQHYHALSASRV